MPPTFGAPVAPSGTCGSTDTASPSGGAPSASVDAADYGNNNGTLHNILLHDWARPTGPSHS